MKQSYAERIANVKIPSRQVGVFFWSNSKKIWVVGMQQPTGELEEESQR